MLVRESDPVQGDQSVESEVSESCIASDKIYRLVLNLPSVGTTFRLPFGVLPKRLHILS